VRALLLWVTAAVISCTPAGRPPEASAARTPRPPNVLILLADDVGVDNITVYGEAEDAPPTPNIDALATRGVLFRQAHASPMCSPTRAGILTGRFGFRYGIGTRIEPRNDTELPLREVTIPEALRTVTPRRYRTAAVGKWHLSAARNPRHPLESGFDSHRGALYNLAGRPLDSGVTQSFFAYKKAEDGEMVEAHTYATTDTVDDALRQIRKMREPWFLYLAFNAAHHPYHLPPAGLHTRDLDEQSPEAELFKADVEAMDTEIGRLLDAMDPAVLTRTTVVFLGDNGTPPAVKTGSEAGRPGKHSTYDGGVRVPLIVAGPPIRPRRQGAEIAALVNHTDLYATVMELAGATVEIPQDSVSLVPYLRDPTHPPLREWVEEEERMIRDARYKLIVRGGSGEELYDLLVDPLETVDLLVGGLDAEQAAAYERLRGWLEELVASEE
jgi:arylsulfatase A-like enzyme